MFSLNLAGEPDCRECQWLSLCKQPPGIARLDRMRHPKPVVVSAETMPRVPTTAAPAIDPLTVNAVLVAVRQAANVLCDRWSLLTLLLAQTGVSRFSDFVERSGMASRLLTSRLAMLEAQEIVVRLAYSRRPLRHDYFLTHMGLSLFDVFVAMARWEQTWHPTVGGRGLVIQHQRCGADAVLPVARCAACDGALLARDIQLVVGQRHLQAMQTKTTAYRRSTLNTTRLGLGTDVPLAHAIDVFGDKWGIELVMCLFTRVRNFNGFQAHLGISTNILSDRLARLTALGILRPASDIGRFGKGAYELTEKGIDLHPILLAIQAWADEWLHDRVRSPVRFTHRVCGKPLRLRLACGHCAEALNRAETRLQVGEDAR